MLFFMAFEALGFEDREDLFLKIHLVVSLGNWG